MTSEVKKSGLLFLALLVFHCCNAKWYMLETEDGGGEDADASGDKEMDKDDDLISELPDDFEFVNDSTENGTLAIDEETDKENKDVDPWVIDCCG